MLRYRADRSSLACVMASATGQAAWLATGKIVFLLPMLALVRWTALVQHNQSHVTLFRHRWANRLLDVTLGTVTGTPMELYREAHARTHHPHTGTPLDWTQPTAVRDGKAVQERPLSHWRYLWVFAPRGWVLGCAAVRRDGARTRSLVVEGAVMAALVAVPLVIGSPLRLLPVVGMWGLVALGSAHANFDHHDGYLAADDRPDFANNTYSPLHTVLGFNIGYHTAHHRRPSAHWSKLPALDAKRTDPGPAEDDRRPLLVAGAGQEPS